MGKWVLLLGGLLVWTAHFFLLYAFASLFPGSATARLLTGVATAAGLAANGLLLWRLAGASLLKESDDLDRWMRDLAATGAILSLVAVAWQGLPALIG